jgi:hypothetical protein
MSGKVGSFIKFIASLESCPEPLKIEQFSFKAVEFADQVGATFLITKVVTKLKT